MRTHKSIAVVLACLITLFLFAGKSYSFTIDASAGPGGTISPSGLIDVTEGDDQTFTITPDPDYGIFEIQVDSAPVDPTLSYTFSNVTKDYTIDVSFFDCNLFPVLLDWNDSLYPSIMEAYDYARIDLGLTDFTLKLRDGIFFTFLENLNFDDADVSVVLDGGYDCSFLDNSQITKISGPITIAAGTVTTSNIAITQGLPCDGTDPNNLPGNLETCDGLDNNCNGLIDEGFDIDGDTVTSCGGDCDDNDPNNFPGNTEICDGRDNDCDTVADNGLGATDADNDGYSAIGACGGSADDCNDNNSSIHPGANDVLGDGIDQDCNGYDLLFPSENECFTCHADLARVQNAHTRVAIPDPSCHDCHPAREASIRDGHYGATVITAGNNMAAGAIIRCTSCHDWHDDYWWSLNPPGADIVWAKVVADDYSVTCYTCHETLDTDHVSATAHNNRVIDPLCVNCHTSDTSVLGQPGSGTLETDADINALHTFAGEECLHCHAYTGTAPDAAIVDQAIFDGFAGIQISCLDCHWVEFPTVHAFIESHNNLVNVGTTGCGDCHNDPPPLVDPDNPKAHAGCFNCHDENYNTINEAAGKSFEVGGDCTTCHTISWETTHTPNTPDHSALVTTTGTGCSSCHTDALVDATTHTGCANCHNTEGSLRSYAVGKDFTTGGDCTTCHTNSWETTHTPNTPDHSALVTTTGTSCTSCHADALVDATTHTGCTNCHNTEGSLRSYAVGKDFTTGGDCTTCHTDPFATIHPDTIDHSALVKVDSTGCGDCHSDPPPLIDDIDPRVHNACSSCHDTGGALIKEAAGKDFDNPGDCTTCHTISWETTHTPNTPDHSALVTTTGTSCTRCHADALVDATTHTGCANCHNSEGSLRSYAVGKDFTTGGDCTTCHANSWETTHTPNTPDHSALVTTTGTGCTSCHADALVDATTHTGCANCHNTEGSLRSYAVGKDFTTGGDCTTCHTGPFATIHPDTVDHSLAIQLSTDCAACHSAPPPLVDDDPLVVDDPKVHDACTSCHNAEGVLIGLAAGNTAPNECISCHGSDLSTLHPSSGTLHTATPGSDNVIVWDAGQHDSAMVGNGTVYIACQTCHSTNLFNVHDNNCSTCHPSPADTVIGTWAGGCQEGGCHTTKHDTVTYSHWTVEDDCTQCHDQQTWNVPATSCANCHATYSPADTTPPVTTSDVQEFYITPIDINFSMTDNGGKVGVGTIYSRVNDGPILIGSSIFVNSVGVNKLEFWSVDQAGNEELPHHTDIFFEIAGDSEPPVTISNALSHYYTPANIMLTATDNSYMGPKTTYYILDTGPTQTGTSVYIPEPLGTVSHVLTFWSDDWSDNVEDPPNTVNFTIHGGTGTLRLVWDGSDISGESPCPNEPNAAAQWTIKRGTATVATGSGACPDWSGVDDIVVDVSPTPYTVTIDWWDDYSGFWDQTTYTGITISAHGQLERLPY